jgi:hypothetical protein
MAGAGVILTIWTEPREIGLVVLLIGVIDLFETTTHRARSIRTRMRSTSSSAGELTFAESEVRIHTDNSNGSIRYAGFQSAIATPNGIFLVPFNVYSIFVPLSSVEPPDKVDTLVQFLLTTINKH